MKTITASAPSINPLIDADHKQTMENVGCVLDFLAGWVENQTLSDAEVFPEGNGAHGLNFIFRCCKSALDFHVNGGGAA